MDLFFKLEINVLEFWISVLENIFVYHFICCFFYLFKNYFYLLSFCDIPELD